MYVAGDFFRVTPEQVTYYIARWYVRKTHVRDHLPEIGQDAVQWRKSIIDLMELYTITLSNSWKIKWNASAQNWQEIAVWVGQTKLVR